MLRQLNPNTVYHVRAYAKQGSDYYYGADKTFTTEDNSSAETKIFYAYSYDWQSKVDAFNAEPTPNPMLIFDGSDGYYESFQGTVILENMTVINGDYSIIYSDGHPYVFYRGTYARVENDLRDGYPSTTVIYGGNFHDLVGSGQYTLYVFC